MMRRAPFGCSGRRWRPVMPAQYTAACQPWIETGASPPPPAVRLEIMVVVGAVGGMTSV